MKSFSHWLPHFAALLLSCNLAAGQSTPGIPSAPSNPPSSRAVPAAGGGGVDEVFPKRIAAPRNLADEFLLPDELEVTLWAESPMFFNPTNIDVDSRGRVWVAEGVNYRRFRNHAGEPLHHPEGDRIIILEDTSGDGAADTAKIFVQDRDLVAPLGVAVIGSRVFVSCSPHLLVYTMDASGDRPAKKEILLTGFGGHDHDHGLHSVAGGPDGRLYFNVGNVGPNIVTDRSGWTLRSGSMYNGGSPHNTNNTPGLVSDDGRVWVSGVALRMDPDGKNLGVVAHNFRNVYEVAPDSFGHLWASDNDSEVRACRLGWLMEGANTGFFSADGARRWQADQRPGQSIPTAHWHQDDPGVLPAGDIYGAGGPTGVAVYEGSLLPERFHGMVLNCDAGRNTVFGHIPKPAGAGYEFERTIFLTSQRGSTEHYKWNEVSMEDRSTWFRPSDVAVGTDGAVYVSDWHDPIVGGHAMRGGSGYGRILRVAPKGSNPRAPKLEMSTTTGQIEALKNPAINVRFAARSLLEENQAARRQLSGLLRSEDPRLRARVVAFHQFGFFQDGLKDENENVRMASWRAARRALATGPGAAKKEFLKLAARMAADSSPAVRREVAIALRDFSFAESEPVLIELASRYEGRDRFHLEALGIGCDGKEEDIYPRLLATLGSADPLEWTEAFAELVWRLHPVAGVPAVAARARAQALSPDARRQAIDTLAFVSHRDAADTMLELALHGPDALVRTNALWWAKFRAGNDWKDFDVARRLPSETNVAEQALQRAVQGLRKTMLDEGAGWTAREQAAVALTETREGALVLVNLASRNRLPPELNEAVSDVIFRNPDPGLRALASQYFKRPSRTGEVFPSLADLVQQRGDVARGREVFFSATAACATCHAFAGSTAGIGPDLTTVRTKLGREGTLDAILNPSAVIAEGYEAWLIETREGDVYSGFIEADGAVVVLRDASGQNRIPAGEIVSRQRQSLSLMPDNLAVGLSVQELVDLVEYLLGADE